MANLEGDLIKEFSVDLDTFDGEGNEVDKNGHHLQLVEHGGGYRVFYVKNFEAIGAENFDDFDLAMEDFKNRVLEIIDGFDGGLYESALNYSEED